MNQPIHSDMKDLSEPFVVTFYPPVNSEKQPVEKAPGQPTTRGRFYPSKHAANATRSFPGLETFHAQYLSQHKELDDKGNIFCFSLAEIVKRERFEENARISHGIVLDFDSTNEILLPNGVSFSFYTSYSHTRVRPKYRLIIPFSHPMNVEGEENRKKFQSVVKNFLLSQPRLPNLEDKFEGKHIIDKRVLVLTQGWFLPSKERGTKEKHWSDYQEGFLLEPEEFTTDRTPSVQVPELKIEDLPAIEERDRQAREALLSFMGKNKRETQSSGSVEGKHGSDRLYTACCFGPDYAIPITRWRETIERIYQPVCVPPFSAAELVRHLMSAYSNSETVKKNALGRACVAPKKKDDGTNGKHPPGHVEEQEEILPEKSFFTPDDIIEKMPLSAAKDLAEAYMRNLTAVQSPAAVIGSVLSIMSMVKGKKYFFPSKKRLFGNLYSIIIGGPGTGKSAALSNVPKVLKYATMGQVYLMPRGMSPNGIVTSLNCLPRHSGIVVDDEFGSFLSSLANGRNKSVYESGIMSTLSFLFSGVDEEQWRGTGFSMKPKDVRPGKKNFIECRHPYLSILGATQEKNVYGIVSPEALNTGFSSRWLYLKPNPEKKFETDYEKECTFHFDELLGPDLTETLRYQANYSDEEFPLDSDPTAEEMTRPVFVTEAGVEFLKLLTNEIHKRRDVVIDGLVNRTVEMVKKIALLVTDSRLIDEDHLRWAYYLVASSVNIANTLVLEERIHRPGNTNREHVFEKVIALIQRGHSPWKGRDHASGVTTLRQIQRLVGRYFSKKDIEDILEHLEVSGLVTVREEKPPTGRATTVVYLKGVASLSDAMH